nr:MAG TPA: hypothetical protein [Caudoviricetes sp.]
MVKIKKLTRKARNKKTRKKQQKFMLRVLQKQVSL